MPDPTPTRALEAWAFVRSMLGDLTAIVVEDAETETELLEGLRVLGRVTALASELTLDADPERPWFFSMNTPMRYVGGPNPDGDYHLCAIDGRRRYRIRGRRGTATYLGFQVLAGQGLTPRRMAAYVSDRTLRTADDGSFELLLARAEPADGERGSASWVEIPADASAVVVRQFFADRAAETPAEYTIEALEPAGPPAAPTEDTIAEQLTAMAWTIAKLTTLHRTILPELREAPNRFVTAEAATLGGENTTPDNLYMLGVFRLAPDEAMVIDAVPPATRYWSLTLENIWHECFDARRRRISLTNARAARRPDGSVRFVVAARDPGTANWLDTGGRHRGFMTFRWLDNPAPPDVRVRVVPVGSVAGHDET